MQKPILNKRQTQELITNLQHFEIPLKFEYLGKGARRWDRLVKSAEYGLGGTETELIHANRKTIFSHLALADSAPLVVDFGCGNGNKISTLVNEMSNNLPISLILVDLSKEMLRLAKKNIKTHCAQVTCKMVICDMEKSADYKKVERSKDKIPHSSCLFSLLGNTIGNFPNPVKVLSNIKGLMQEGDVLLIGTETNDGDNEKGLIKHYTNKEIFNIQFSLLETLGVSKSDGTFMAEYNTKKSQIETYFMFKRDVVVNYLTKTVAFPEGSKVLLMVSKKFVLDDFLADFQNAGLSVSKTIVDHEKHYCLILAAPTNTHPY